MYTQCHAHSVVIADRLMSEYHVLHSQLGMLKAQLLLGFK